MFKMFKMFHVSSDLVLTECTSVNIANWRHVPPVKT